MTYDSKGRSMMEVVIAVGFVCFLIGFVTVLCVGNYYRARKAMERQRQKRLARLSGNAGNGVIGLDDQQQQHQHQPQYHAHYSPQSDHSSASTQFADDHHHQQQQQQRNPLLPNWNGNNDSNFGPSARRRHLDGQEETLLFDMNDAGPRAHIASI